jgi:hypothetical protein
MLSRRVSRYHGGERRLEWLDVEEIIVRGRLMMMGVIDEKEETILFPIDDAIYADILRYLNYLNYDAKGRVGRVLPGE